VEHVTFSGAYAAGRGQSVLYVTERCVFALTPDGIELIEVAPGIYIEREILARMDFKPVIPRDPIAMDRDFPRRCPDCATICCHSADSAHSTSSDLFSSSGTLRAAGWAHCAISGS
jgi:acyl CoA:acetate/3-ketoacid CoA transferase